MVVEAADGEDYLGCIKLGDTLLEIAAVLELLVEVSAPQVVHHKEDLLALLEDVVDVHDEGMRELQQNLFLTDDVCQLLAADILFGDDLHRKILWQLLVHLLVLLSRFHLILLPHFLVLVLINAILYQIDSPERPLPYLLYQFKTL